jgi:hypothetical protein
LVDETGLTPERQKRERERKYSRRVGEGGKILGKVKDTLLWGGRKSAVFI